MKISVIGNAYSNPVACRACQLLLSKKLASSPAAIRSFTSTGRNHGPTKSFGKLSTSLSMGVVGLPNVGKSSLFNALTKSEKAFVANYPFATIDPAVSKAEVPDPRLTALQQIYGSRNRLPVFLNITDIAGLVKGASSGAGMGNGFLSHVQACDGIFGVVRAFEDESVEHVEETVDPVRDIDIITSELMQKDIEVLGKFLEKLNKKSSKATAAESAALEKAITFLKAGKEVRFGDWEDSEIDILNSYPILTSKPVVYILNVSETSLVTNSTPYLEAVRAHVGDQPVHLMSANYEDRFLLYDTADDPDLLQELKELAEELGVEEEEVRSRVGEVVIAGFEAVGLRKYYTCGPEEARAWSIKKGYKAPKAAGVIHSDFEAKFISSEIMAADDIISLGSPEAVKAAGKLKVQGKDYEVQDGDVVLWKHT